LLSLCLHSWGSETRKLQAAVNVEVNKVPTDGMRLFHTREVIQDLDGIVLREEPDWGTLTFDLVRPYVVQMLTAF
jgi:hypothetical protein